MNYNRFLIKNKCLLLSERMVYFPFNDEITFEERSYNSYTGAINMSNLERSVLRLRFNNPHAKVKIYAIGMNNYIQSRGMGRLEFEANMHHIKQDFTLHPPQTYEQIISHAIPIRNNRRNIVNNIINSISNTRPNINTNTNSITFNDIYRGGYGSYTPGYYQSSYSHDSSINTISNEGEYNEIVIFRIIREDKRTCGISLEEIQINERYMSCSMCNNNFKENALKRWIESRSTCPSCRVVWSDNHIYVNIHVTS